MLRDIMEEMLRQEKQQTAADMAAVFAHAHTPENPEPLVQSFSLHKQPLTPAAE